MSWLFSQALVAAFSEENSLDGELCAELSVMPTQHPFSHRDKTTDCSTLSRFGLTCAVLTERRGEELLTWFLADFPVKTFRPQELATDSPANGRDCGEKWRGSFARWFPDSCSWRTPQRSLDGDLIKFSETWPRWGSMRNGACSTGRCSVPRLSENAFLLPGPTKCMGQRGWGLSRTGRARYSEQLIKNALSFGYKPHPQVLEWSMGWPITWSGLAPLGTDKFQQWLRSHGRN